MKSTFKLEGLACANCATKMERVLIKQIGITSCQINFMTSKMVLEHDEDADFELMEKAIKKIESHVKLTKIS